MSVTTFPRLPVRAFFFCFASTRANASQHALVLHRPLSDIRRNLRAWRAIIASGSEYDDTANCVRLDTRRATLGHPDRFFGIPVVVNKTDTGLGEVQRAAYFSLNTPRNGPDFPR